VKGGKKGPEAKERERKEKGKVGSYFLAIDEAKKGGIYTRVQSGRDELEYAGRKVSREGNERAFEAVHTCGIGQQVYGGEATEPPYSNSTARSTPAITHLTTI
jgi:hypothetical protein